MFLMLLALGATFVAAETEPGTEAAKPAEELGPYPISRLDFHYAAEDPAYPALSALATRTIKLSAAPNGYTAAKPGEDGQEVALGELGSLPNPRFYGSAIVTILNGAKEYLQEQGFDGVIIQPDPRDIDEGRDRRQEDNHVLRVIISVAKIGQVRVLPAGERKEVNATVAERISEKSPVQTGGPLNIESLNTYLYRLNRHPGRRVDVAIAPSIEEGSLTVDYLLNENKAWFVFFQISNTGTKSTNVWRERFGFVHNQLTGHDDIFSVEYITAGFDASHAVVGSYEAPVFDSSLARWRISGTWATFDASEVGQAGEKFNGDQWDVSAQMMLNVLQFRTLFIDVFAGARVQYVRVENETFVTTGEDYFALPFVGVSLEEYTELTTTTASLSVEGNVSALAGTKDAEILKLGRSNVTKDFVILHWNVSHSVYLEPLFQALFGQRPAVPETATLAHEIFVSFRGQYTFNERVVPQFEQILGGRYTVRGYDESIAAGDGSMVFSLEYRFHFPRLLAPAREPMQTPFGPFKFRPQEAYDRPDWDLMLRAFVDVGRTINAKRLSFEQDETLVGVGLGVELLIKKNLSIQLDWGVALEDAGVGSVRVQSGDSRLHLVATILF